MPIIFKYLIKEILKYYFLVLMLVAGIFIAVDYLGTMDEFIKAEISLMRALEYVLLRMPFMLIQLTPVTILLSVLMVFGIMSKNNEIIVLKSSGISSTYLLWPIVTVSIFFGILQFVFAEVIVPVSMHKANLIKHIEIKKRKATTSQQKDIWIKGKKKITHIRYYHPSEQSIFDITVYYFNDIFKLKKRIDAKKGVFRDNKWILGTIMEQTMDDAGEPSIIKFPATKELILGFSPDDLQKLRKKSEEMNIFELCDYIKQTEDEGYDATTYRVDMFAKTAFPFVCIIMGLIGTGLTARGKLNRGLPVSIAFGIGIAFLFMVSNSLFISFGYGEIFPPFIAAWLCNIIFFCLGCYILLSAEK